MAGHDCLFRRDSGVEESTPLDNKNPISDELVMKFKKEPIETEDKTVDRSLTDSTKREKKHHINLNYWIF